MVENSKLLTEKKNRSMREFGSKSIMRWATLKDMQGSQFKKIFADLEDYQSRFFSVQDKVKVGPYAWPLRPLYEWSRRVEYPFVDSLLPREKGIRVLDAGSGVTFFPFYLAQVLGMNVKCMDREQSYAERIRQNCDLLGLSPSIQFHLGDLTKKMPFEEGIFNIVLSISVLEHLPVESRLEAVYELWRLVAPGGRLIMTFDVSLTGEEEGLLLSEVEEFVSRLSELAGPLPSISMPPPPDLLTPQNPGYGLAPVQVGIDGPLIRSGSKSWLLRLQRRPLPIFKPLACLLCSISKSL